MTNSSKRRKVQAYRESMEALDDLCDDKVDDALDAIDDYVGWLVSQITTKRQTIQAMTAELDELRR